MRGKISEFFGTFLQFSNLVSANDQHSFSFSLTKPSQLIVSVYTKAMANIGQKKVFENYLIVTDQIIYKLFVSVNAIFKNEEKYLILSVITENFIFPIVLKNMTKTQQ